MAAIYLTADTKCGFYPRKASGFLTREGEERTHLTPKQAIREHCIDCVGGVSSVRDCQGNELFDSPCILFPYRMGTGRPSVRLIRKFCLYCMGGSWKLIRQCLSPKCPFLHYRMGKNPNIQLSEIQRQRKRNLIAAARRHRPKSSKVASGIEKIFQESTNNMAPIP